MWGSVLEGCPGGLVLNVHGSQYATVSSGTAMDFATVVGSTMSALAAFLKVVHSILKQMPIG